VFGIANPTPRTIICIPGHWSSRVDLLRRISKKSDGYAVAGQTLVDTETKEAFTLEVDGHDERLASAFRAAGQHWATEDDLAAISRHTFALYLIGEGGSCDRAASLMAAADALLRAGGYAVKVESTGLAHSADDWHELVEQRHLQSTYRAFVVVVSGRDVYSCGMHNLGLRDAIVRAEEDDDPAELIRAFTFYAFSEAPVIREGDRFSVRKGAPRFRLASEECNLYGEDDPFTNPYGMWRLRSPRAPES